MDPDRLLSQWWTKHSLEIKVHIESTINELISNGRREPEPVVTLLKRDRLFRLAALYDRSVLTSS